MTSTEILREWQKNPTVTNPFWRAACWAASALELEAQKSPQAANDHKRAQEALPSGASG